MRHSMRPARSSATRRIAAALLLGAGFGAIAIGIAMPAPAHAQEVGASLRGRITGDSAIQQVTAIEVATGVSRTVQVGADGRYNFASLRPGTYRLEITTADGVRQTDEFDLQVAQNAVLDFDLGELAPGPAAGAEPAAPGAEPGVEAAGADSQNTILVIGTRLRTLEGAEVGDAVTRREIELLPQINRNFLAFADTAPGVQFITEDGGNTRIRGGAQNSNSVNVFIDGISQKDYVLRGGITGQDTSPGNPFPQLAISEYRVLSSNYKAEFDQVSSVAITAVTRSGTNRFEGEGFFDYTNQDLRAARPSETEGPNPSGKVDSKEMQFGGALAGPIIPDTLFFFATYEGKRIDTPYTITPGAGLAASALPPEYQGYFGTAVDELKSDLYFGKLDFVPTDRDLFQLSVKYRDETSENGDDGSTAEEYFSVTEVEELRGVFRYERTNDNWINDFKVSYEDVSWAPTPTSFEPGFIFENGNNGRILAFGGGAGYQDKGQEGWTVQNDFTWTGTERHTLKAGVKARWITLSTLEQNNFNPQYTFNAAFGDGFNDTRPYRLQFGALTGAGDPIVESDNFQFGIYIQDDWEVTERLTLNLGVRWDYEETPAYLDYVHDAASVAAVSPANYPNLVNADYDIADFISTGTEREAFTGAIQPRIGFSYEIDEEGRFVLFGGYGRSYDRSQFDFLQQEIQQGAYATRSFQFQNGDPLRDCQPLSSTCLVFDPVYLTQAGRDQLLAGLVIPSGGRELRFIDNDLKVPYSDQFSLGVRGRFDLLEVEVGYRHIQGRDIFTYLLGNRLPDGSFFPPNAPQNSPFGSAPPGWGSIIIGTNGGRTNEDAAHIKIDKRYTEFSPWSLTSTYTYMEAEENVPGGGQFFLDFPSAEVAPMVRSSGVPRHRWVTTGAVDTVAGFTVSGRLLVQSPEFIKGIYTPEQPPFARDVLGTVVDSGWIHQLDLALTKYIPLRFASETARLRLRMDVINVLDEANWTQFNGNANDTTRTADSPTIFGERTGFGTGGYPPRTLKLTAGFSF